MILCVGPSGSGKTVLLRYLVAQEEFSSLVSSAKGGAANAAAVSNAGAAAFGKKNLTASVGTVGTNLVTLTRPRAKKDSGAAADSVVVREVGGSMAPLWHSYIEPAKTRGVLYTVDAASPETIGTATIYLVELLNQPGLEMAQVMVVFTKTDLPSARSLSEIRALMRMEQICATSKQLISFITFSAQGVIRALGTGQLEEEINQEDKIARDKLDELHKWCLRFAAPKDKN